MDENIQTLLKNKYNIIWREDDSELTNPLLIKKFANYIPDKDSLYYTFKYQPLIDLATFKPSPQNLFQNRGVEEKLKDHIVLKISDQFFFKGTKTFYRENQQLASYRQRIFSNQVSAFNYARKYNGGINVYKPNKVIRLLVLSNVDNIKKILHHYSKKNNKLVFPIQMKFGVNTTIFTRVDYFLKTTQQTQMLLNAIQYTSPLSGIPLPIEKNFGIMDLWKIDKLVDHAICDYCNNYEFDGYIIYEHYTPFMKYGSEKVFVCNYYKTLDRDPSHPLDWLRWEKHLPIVIEPDFLLEERYAIQNRDFRVIKYWNYNKMDTKENKKLHLEIQKIKKKLVLATLNVNNFYSVNHYDDGKTVFKKFVLFIKNFEIDLIAIQELKFDDNFDLKYIEKKIKKIDYNITFTETRKNAGNAVISRYQIRLVKEIVLSNKQIPIVRKATFFKLDDKSIDKLTFCNTQLELGLPYVGSDTSLLPESQIIQNIDFNSELRKLQLTEIFSENPDIIMGDLIFEPIDSEFKVIEKYYETSLSKIETTNVFDTITDYIFYKKTLKLKPKIAVVPNYRYSDHLPVLNVLL